MDSDGTDRQTDREKERREAENRADDRRSGIDKPNRGAAVFPRSHRLPGARLALSLEPP